MPSIMHGVPVLPHDVISRVGRPGILEDPRLAAAVLTAGAASALLGIWRVRRGRRRQSHPPLRRRLLRLGGLATVLLLLVAGALLAVNVYAGYVPTTGALLDALRGHPPGGPAAPEEDIAAGGQPIAGGVRTQGRLVSLSVGAAALHIAPRRLNVLLPAGYDDRVNAGRRYPVIYLIHGHPGGPMDWLTGGRVDRSLAVLTARHLIHPMIIAMPDASGSWIHDSECLNQVDGPQDQTYLTSTVVATVDQDFRTIPTAAGRAIGGMSSGAYCALNLGLRHQQVFSTILASEPYGDPGTGVLQPLLHGNRQLWLANAPVHYLPTLRIARPMAVFLDVSANDHGGRKSAVALANLLARHDHVYLALRIAPNFGHTWREVRFELPYSLVFASHHLRADSEFAVT